MLNIPLLVDEYIKSKNLAWARTSQKNERHRLNAHGHNVMSDPNLVYETLKNRMVAYSIKTTFVRLGQFLQYLIDNDKIAPIKNHWKVFIKTNALLFKYAYQAERLTKTYTEAYKLINTMEYPYRNAALQLLEGGLRYCELRTFDGERVIGKGNKPRSVFLRTELASINLYRNEP